MVPRRTVIVEEMPSRNDNARAPSVQVREWKPVQVATVRGILPRSVLPYIKLIKFQATVFSHRRGPCQRVLDTSQPMLTAGLAVHASNVGHMPQQRRQISREMPIVVAVCLACRWLLKIGTGLVHPRAQNPIRCTSPHGPQAKAADVEAVRQRTRLGGPETLF